MFETVKKFTMIIVGAAISSIGMNLFMIPADVYSGGFTGVAQLIARLFQDQAPFLSTGVVLALLNIPIAIVAWMKLGKSFTIYSFSNVAFTTLFLEMIPIYHVSNDILLNAVFGGVIVAIGVGITLRGGASTGGIDVIAILLSRSKGKSIGSYSFVFNGIIVTIAGALFGWEQALYTIVSIFAMSRVVDMIYTAHAKLTAMVVTSKGEELAASIQEKLVRGVTHVPARGSYSKEEKDMLMVVLSRYELISLQQIIHEIDPKAFTNIVQTVGVVGLFRKE